MSICADGRLSARGCLARFSSGWGAVSSLVVAGCFEVPQIALEPTALEIDDFEDGDEMPSSSLFAAWHCETSPGPRRASCGPAAPGFASDMAEAVRFEITDPANGSVDYASVLLETSSRLDPVDLGGYQSLAFSAKFERTPGVGASSGADEGSEAVELFVQLACDGVGQSGSLPYGSWLEHVIPIGPDWSGIRIELAELIRPSYVPDFKRIDCLTNVEALIFVLGAEPTDGAALAGTLTVDDVSLN
jgi:hypothetical protein